MEKPQAGCGLDTASGSEPLMLMLRTMGFGAGYHAPQETAAALQALRPHMTSEGQAFFENLGRTSAQTGGQISNEQLQQGMGHLQSAARARDQQYVPKDQTSASLSGCLRYWLGPTGSWRQTEKAARCRCFTSSVNGQRRQDPSARCREREHEPRRRDCAVPRA